MIYTAVCLFYLVLFSYIIYKWRFFSYSHISGKYFIGVFLLKVFVGIFIWEFYTKNIGVTDADTFFYDSKVFYNLALESPRVFFKLFFGLYHEPYELYEHTSRMFLWRGDFNTFLINDSRTVIRLHALIQFFSFGFFHVHTIFSAFISLTGLNLIFKSLLNTDIKNVKLLFLIIFLIPSVLFWSSLVLKESLVFIGIGLVLFNTGWGLKKDYSIWNIIGFFTGLFFMFILKYYLLLALLPALMSNQIFVRLRGRRIYIIYFFVFFFSFLLLTQIHRLTPSFDPVKGLKGKQLNFNKMAKGGVFLYGNGHYVYVDYQNREQQLTYKSDTTCYLKPDYFYKHFHQNQQDTVLVSGREDTTCYWIAFSIPPSKSRTDVVPIHDGLGGLLLSCVQSNLKLFFLFGLLEQQNDFSLFAFAENAVCLLLFLLLLRYRVREQKSIPFILTVLSFVLILHAFIGITTPVWGSIVRYRMPALLFLMILFVVLFDSEKFKKEMKQRYLAMKT